MFKHYFERIIGIEIYPIISLFVFLLFFTGLIIWVLKADKKYIQNMRHIPLDNSEPENIPFSKTE